MIRGVPYFGEDNNEIRKHILESEYTDTLVVYNTVVNLIQDNLDKHIIVIIDNKWLSWLNDIVFNYRDKKLYIPYFTYELHDTGEVYKTDKKGHLILSDYSTVVLRHSYKYEKLELDLNNFRLSVYDLDTNEKYKITAEKWYNDTFDINELYNRYLDCAYKDDDFNLNKHHGGYHFIDKNLIRFENLEKKLREQHDLDTYAELIYDKDFRDVRNFKYEEVVQKVGFRKSLELYNIRRLKFDSLLYCIMRQDSVPVGDAEFEKEWCKLGKSFDHIKYGKNIKLIFKSYWLNEYAPVKKKSWSRI